MMATTRAATTAATAHRNWGRRSGIALRAFGVRRKNREDARSFPALAIFALNRSIGFVHRAHRIKGVAAISAVIFVKWHSFLLN